MRRRTCTRMERSGVLWNRRREMWRSGVGEARGGSSRPRSSAPRRRRRACSPASWARGGPACRVLGAKPASPDAAWWRRWTALAQPLGAPSSGRGAGSRAGVPLRGRRPSPGSSPNQRAHWAASRPPRESSGRVDGRWRSWNRFAGPSVLAALRRAAPAKQRGSRPSRLDRALRSACCSPAAAAQRAQCETSSGPSRQTRRRVPRGHAEFHLGVHAPRNWGSGNGGRRGL